MPFKDWFERLDPHAAANVATAVTWLSLGNTSNVKWFSVATALMFHSEYKARKKARGKRLTTWH